MVKKKRKNSRRKGCDFERKIAKDFTDWCGFSCKRTPMSGGWSKTGDVTPRDPEQMVDFIFNTELKNQEGWSFSSSFLGDSVSKQIKKWWSQCSADAKDSGRIPLLIFTKSYDRIYCMARASFFNKVGLKVVAKKVVMIPNFRIFLWEDLLTIPYEEIKMRVRKI